jgi:GNAT superfamily N-acetyltransferase
MATSTEFIIRDYRPEDESAVLALIQLGMGGGPTGERDALFWRWKHFENPFGKSVAMVAEDRAGQIIGLRTFMQWRFLAGNSPVRAVRAVDTVTHPDYRRYGVFSRLTSQALQRVTEDGFGLIFNTPNNQVLPGYLKLGWDYVSMVRPLINILNYPRFAAGMIRSRNRSRSSGQLPPEQVFGQGVHSVSEFLGDAGPLARLMESRQEMRNGRLLTSQSPEYLRWRYSRYPNVNYGVVYGGGTAAAGCAILRSSTRFGLKEAVIADLLLPSPDERMASSLLNNLKRGVKADYLIAYFPEGSFPRRMLHKHGFHRVPRGGQNFTVKILARDLPCDPRLLQNWDISLGDLEVF